MSVKEKILAEIERRSISGELGRLVYTPNELCEWLWQMGAIPPEVAEPILGVKGDYRGWNLPACAFAARDYIGNGVREWGEIGLLESTIEKISGFRAFYAQPIDCLRAAALVIAGREK